MTRTALRRLVPICLLALAGTAAAQAPQTYSYPGTPTTGGVASPPSTLRITETPQAATGAAPAGPAGRIIRDTPESLREYRRCRTVSDRAAVGNAQMQAGAALCLKELEARRAGGQ